MRADFEKTRILECRLNEIIGELTYQKEKVKGIIRTAELNDFSENTVASLKKICDDFDAQILTAIKMKEASKRISELYRLGEERISSYIENGVFDKQEFRFCTYLQERTDFDWSIK